MNPNVVHSSGSYEGTKLYELEQRVIALELATGQARPKEKELWEKFSDFFKNKDVSYWMTFHNEEKLKELAKIAEEHYGKQTQTKEKESWENFNKYLVRYGGI